MDEAQLEHRLTKIEEAQKTAATVLQAQHDAMMLVLGEVKGALAAQNGRVGKLETWRTQVGTLYGVLLFAAPFVFYGLMKMFGG